MQPPSDMGERTDRQGEKIDAHWQLEYLRNPLYILVYLEWNIPGWSKF